MKVLASHGQVRSFRALRGHWPGLILKHAATRRATSCARETGRDQWVRKKTEAMEMMLFMQKAYHSSPFQASNRGIASP
ncbi:hypothetical protein [Bradyrhizobium sp. HKCCYLR20261]|uniref:hypothetical protein n=1 Tax=unclassified Bradyrhizobium TaxID=2631580 RepID=UPI003EC07C82